MNDSPTLLRSSLRFTRRFAKIQTRSPENSKSSEIRKNSTNESDSSYETSSPLHVKRNDNDNNYSIPSPPPGPILHKKEKDLILPHKSTSPARFLPEILQTEKKQKPSFITTSSASSLEGILPSLTRKSLTIHDKAMPPSKVISPIQASNSKKMKFGDDVSFTNDSGECSHSSLEAEYRTRIAKNAHLLKHRIKTELLQLCKIDNKLALTHAQQGIEISEMHNHADIPTILLTETFLDPIHSTIPQTEAEIESTVEFMQNLINYKFGSTNTEYSCCISDLKRDVSTFLVSKDYLSLVSSPTGSPSPSDGNDALEDFVGTLKQPLHKKSPRRIAPTKSPSATEQDICLDGIQGITLPVDSDNYQYTPEDVQNDEQLLQEFIQATKKGLFYDTLRAKMFIQKNLKRKWFLEKALLLVHEAQKI